MVSRRDLAYIGCILFCLYGHRDYIVQHSLSYRSQHNLLQLLLGKINGDGLFKYDFILRSFILPKGL